MRAVVICSTDLVWASPVWDRALPFLISNGVEVVMFVEVTGRPKKMREISYLRSFGLGAVVCFALLALVGLAKRILRVRPLTLKGICARHGTDYTRVASANSQECRALLSRCRPDALIVMTEFILTPEILQIPQKGSINNHAALLPAYRGLLPYFWARLEGAPQGISYHLVTPKIDAGEVLLQRRYDGPETRSLIAFYTKVFSDYPRDVLEALHRLDSGRCDGESDLEPSYRSFPSAADYRLFRKAGGRLVTWRDFVAGVPA